MNLQQIKQAISSGKSVKWANDLYNVIEKNGEYYIVCSANDNTISLTWKDKKTLNGKEKDFYIKEEKTC